MSPSRGTAVAMFGMYCDALQSSDSLITLIDEVIANIAIGVGDEVNRRVRR